MFIGEYNHTIDTKGRLIVPAKFREELGEHFFVTKGFDGCLFAFDRADFEELQNKIMSLPLSNKLGRELKRFFIGSAEESEFDKQGRILLPAPLREHAGLDKDVALIGVGSRIEIWSKERYEAAEEGLDADEIAIKLEEFGLSL